MAQSPKALFAFWALPKAQGFAIAWQVKLGLHTQPGQACSQCLVLLQWGPCKTFLEYFGAAVWFPQAPRDRLWHSLVSPSSGDTSGQFGGCTQNPPNPLNLCHP